MDFFKKGKDFYLRIDGIAHIMNDPEQINSLIDLPDDVKLKAMHESILIKVKILKADYFECGKSVTSPWIEKLREQFHNLVFNHRAGYRPYKLEPDRLAY